MKNPIGPKEREKLAAIEKRLTEWVNLAQKCKAAGIDMTEREAAAAYLYDRLQAFRSEFLGVAKESPLSPPPAIPQ